ncbi:putative gag-pol polyprotein [Trichonephila clavipes]|nr:putative gag-pol polyprotein [Trichonephila clavipes]
MTLSGYNLFASKLEFECKQLIYSFLCTGREVVLQWIPSHYAIHRNEHADKLAKEASTLHSPCLPMPLRNAKRLPRNKFRQKRISTLTDLAVGKSWSRLFIGQRRTQLSALPSVEGVACFRIITGHDYLQAHMFKIGLVDSPLCPLCKSEPMSGEHRSDCPALLHVLSKDNCGVILSARATSVLYWTTRRLMSERAFAGLPSFSKLNVQASTTKLCGPISTVIHIAIKITRRSGMHVVFYLGQKCTFTCHKNFWNCLEEKIRKILNDLLIEDIVSRVLIESSALKQVVTFHRSMAFEWPNLVSSQASRGILPENHVRQLCEWGQQLLQVARDRTYSG